MYEASVRSGIQVHPGIRVCLHSTARLCHYNKHVHAHDPGIRYFLISIANQRPSSMHMRRIVSYLGLQDCLISVARSQLGISERELVARSAPLPFHSVNNGITGYRLFSQAKESTGFCAVKARGSCEKCPPPLSYCY